MEPSAHFVDEDSPNRNSAWQYFRIAILSVAVLFVLFLSGKIWWKHAYPYGTSHSCSAGLAISLIGYAHENGGWLPHGLQTPEASLSLLHTNDPMTATWFMRGKHLPQSVVDQALARDGCLSPDTCGWHYVEGLREGDALDIAVAWDKVEGLDHNGRRRSGLMHEVAFLDGSHTCITKDEWAEFVKKQKHLLAEVIAKRPLNSPPVRWSDEQTLGPNKFPPPAISKSK